jgi:hypothetical protein
MVRVAKSFDQTKERLRAQTTYQTPHVAMVRVAKSFVEAKERLQAQTIY